MATEPLIVLLDAKTAKIDAKLKETERRLDQLDSSVTKTENSLVKMGRAGAVSALAAAAAISTLSATTVVFARELEIASNRANTTVEEMQSLSFAANTVGISLEKIGDISKDTNEKIGEFIATGGGGFVDFVDVMKLSRAEANVLAREFQKLSGPEVLERMVSLMEDAGVSGNQMSFALEGVASDATDLLPLLKDNANELNRLKGEFESLGVTLTQEQIDRIKTVGEEFSKLGETFGAEGRQLIADYSEEIILAIEVIETLGTKSVDAFNVISVGWGNIIELGKAAIDDLINGNDGFSEALLERTELTTEAINNLLNESQEGIDITIRKGVEVTKSASKEEKASLDQRLKNFAAYSSAANAINNAFLNENKAIKAGLIVADTAAAVMMQLSSGDPYTAFARAAAAAAMGAAQLANALSSSKGGGSVSGGEGSQSSSSTSTQSQDFQTETSDLQLTSLDESGAQTINLVLSDADGNRLADFIAPGLDERTRQGR